MTSSEDGAALGAVVKRATGLPWAAAKRAIAQGRVTLDGAVVTDAGRRTKAGQSVALHASARRAAIASGAGSVGDDRAIRAGDARVPVAYLDAHLVVVDKPAGISTVPYDEGERGTLVDRVRVQLHRDGDAPANAPLFVVHRIDKDTSGLVVFGRTWLAKRHLAALFRAHAIERVYLALVEGHLARDRVTFDSHLVANRGDGLRGSAKQAGLGQRAVTHVEVVARLSGATLVRARLETGRTHQIRIHLAEAGHPIVGERVYSRHFAGARVEAPRTMLHAATLGFAHPARPDGEDPVRVACAPPRDFAELTEELGGTVPPY